MSTGTIGRLMRNHGFGFIKTAEGVDLFFHNSEVQNIPFSSLEEGQKVGFKINLGPKGLKATNVRLLEDEIQVNTLKKNDRDLISLGIR